MSWEKFKPEKEKCHCGKGYQVSIMYMDDWSRIKFDIFIDCEDCYKKYCGFKLVENIDKYCEEVIL